MKKILLLILLWVSNIFSAGEAAAGETGHFICGVEGIRLGSAPPPGFYYKIYNVFYNTHTIKDNNGKQASMRPDIQDYVMVHRPIWVTRKKFLGANYYTTLLIPFAYADFKVKKAGISDRRWSNGDICFEFLGLAWHRKHRDSLFSMAAYLPTGEYSRHKPASLGKDFWTLLISYGDTFFLDKNRLWTASAMVRHELHSRKRRTHVRPGQVISLEWSLSRSFEKLWDLGIAGYAQWQITDDSGHDVTYPAGVHDRVFALGPELCIYIPFLRVRGQLRHQIEFGARDRSQGAITNISFTITF
ncbi:MAG: hypothetical protein GY868_21865 [Deltaproteobacteria bacterium]|nr:hypothetical protein [Deltaproteobacteria bacterium]